MATIADVKPKYGPGRQEQVPDDRPITSLEITFAFDHEEGRLLPAHRRIAKTFGPALHYESTVMRKGATLVVRYLMAAAPFGTTDPRAVPSLALEHVNKVLNELAHQKKPSPEAPVDSPRREATMAVFIEEPQFVRGRINQPDPTHPITSVRLHILLTGDEATRLPSPKHVKSFLGNGVYTADSIVHHTEGELSLVYQMSHRPFNGARAEDIPRLALEDVRRKLGPRS